MTSTGGVQGKWGRHAGWIAVLVVTPLSRVVFHGAGVRFDASSLDVGENNGFRVMVEPLLWALTAAVISDGVGGLRSRRAPTKGR